MSYNPGIKAATEHVSDKGVPFYLSVCRHITRAWLVEATFVGTKTNSLLVMLVMQPTTCSRAETIYDRFYAFVQTRTRREVNAQRSINRELFIDTAQ